MRKIAKYTIEMDYEVCGDVPVELDGKIHTTEEAVVIILDGLTMGLEEGTKNMCDELSEDGNVPIKLFNPKISMEMLDEPETEDPSRQAELSV